MSKKKKATILEVNNIDVLGKRFNGYDLSEYMNKHTNLEVKQIANLLKGSDSTSLPLYDNHDQFIFEQNLADLEYRYLSTHSQLSISTDFLINNHLYKDASLIHFHMFHNSRYNLYSLKKITSAKPVIITFHDMWFLTGRCVQPYNCTKWLDGCEDCKYLKTNFPMHIDNCNELWKLKDYIFKNIDVDVVVTSQYMLEAAEKRNFVSRDRLHLIPFGLDLKIFYDNGEKSKLKIKMEIPKENIVLFFRAQKEFKGIEYIIEALKQLEVNKKITLISCGEIGLLKTLKNKYQVIELGIINTDKLIDCYRVCDVFLMPSKGESFGLMAIEAMACSRAVIIFDNTALPSVTFAPDCGILVENRDSYKLMKAIEMIVNNKKERIRRGKLGRQICEQHYDIDTHHLKMNELYKSVLKRKYKENKLDNNVNINYDSPDVNKLIKKLFFITKDLFGDIPETFKDYFKNFKVKKICDDDLIMYSDKAIQNMIEQYNNLLYLEVKQNKVNFNATFSKKIKKKYKTFKFLLNHDQEKLIEIIKQKIFKM